MKMTAFTLAFLLPLLALLAAASAMPEDDNYDVDMLEKLQRYVEETMLLEEVEAQEEDDSDDYESEAEMEGILDWFKPKPKPKKKRRFTAFTAFTVFLYKVP